MQIILFFMNYFFFHLLFFINIKNGKVTVNDFMDSMMSDPSPACLVWLPLLHRLANVENGLYIYIFSVDLDY